MRATGYAVGQSDERPWGNWRVIGSEAAHGYALKQIVVLPGKRLSLQYHRHRAEHWIVVAGTGQATIGDEEIVIARGNHIHVPHRALHRLTNTGSEPLVVVELQYGELLDESDIVRVEDDFARA